MVQLPAAAGAVWPVLAGGVGLSAATFLLYRTFARWQADTDGSTQALLWAQFTVVPVAAVAAAGLFVVAARAYLLTATALVAGLGVRTGRTAVLVAAVGLWSATLLAGALGGIHGYAPLADRRGTRSVPLAERGRTAAAVAAVVVVFGAVLALLLHDPLAAAAAVAVGRPATAAAAPAAVAAVERTRPLPEPWNRRVPEVADRVGVAVRGGRVVADGEADVALAGLASRWRVLFVTERALSSLDDAVLGALVARELVHARRHTAVERVAVETVPVAVWLASFEVLGPGRAVFVGGLLVGPYAVAVGYAGLRAEYAADEAAADVVGRDAVVSAIRSEAAANGVPERRDRLYDLLVARPAPARRVERLLGGPDGGEPPEAGGVENGAD